MTDNSTKLDFENLYAAKQIVDQLRSANVGSLALFWDPTTKGFKRSQTEEDGSRLSISSTTTCVGSLAITGAWKARLSKTGDMAPWAGEEDHIYRSLLSANWSSGGLEPNNPFSVAFVIEATQLLLQIIGNIDPARRQSLRDERCDITAEEAKQRKRAKLGIQRDDQFQVITRNMGDHLRRLLLEHRNPGCISVLQYPPSAFLTQLATRSLDKLEAISDADKDEVSDWASREIAIQITLIKSGSRNADPLELMYLVLCLVSFRSRAKESPHEALMVRYAIDVFFDCQLADGSWPLSKPLFHYPASSSAYCYDYEALAQLLMCDKLHDILFGYLPQILKSTATLLRTKFSLDSGLFGWASNENTQGAGPESWPTASVYLYLFALDRFIAEGVRRSIANELGVQYSGVSRNIKRKGSLDEFATMFLDCPLSAQDKEGSLKAALFDRLVKPLSVAAPMVAKGLKLPDSIPISAILFGPPGTSKTDIIEQVAEYIGWPSFSVDPSYFVRLGIDAIQGQANNIFKMLSIAEEIIVLFDEFDEMVRNRESADELLSRFLTTAMLPRLARINKQRKILFVVATNYIESFDTAISRAGRFDYVVQMMPPKTTAKLSAPDLGATKGWAMTLSWIKNMLERADFDEELADLTFLETKAIVTIARRLRDGNQSDLKTAMGAKWVDAIRRCTMRRALADDAGTKTGTAVEQGAGIVRTSDKEGGGVNCEAAAKSWKRKSESQVRFIRFEEV